jgi:hypothetical protein
MEIMPTMRLRAMVRGATERTCDAVGTSSRSDKCAGMPGRGAGVEGPPEDETVRNDVSIRELCSAELDGPWVA